MVRYGPIVFDVNITWYLELGRVRKTVSTISDRSQWQYDPARFIHHLFVALLQFESFCRPPPENKQMWLCFWFPFQPRKRVPSKKHPPTFHVRPRIFHYCGPWTTSSWHSKGLMHRSQRFGHLSDLSVFGSLHLCSSGFDVY